MFMKKFLSLVFAGTMCLTALSGCGSTASSANTASDVASGSDSSAQVTFTVGFDAEFPPYGYQDADGAYVGFDLDLAQEVCARRGWQYVAKPIDWASKDLELNSGSIDCIWNGFTINGREDAYTWSKPYVDNSQVIVTTADSGIVSFADLADKNVAVQSGSSALASLNDESNPDTLSLRDSFAQLLEVPDYNTAFMNLESGAVDAVAMDVGVANYEIAQRGTEKFAILDEKIAEEQYGIGFQLGNETLRDEVQDTLDEMVQDGTFATIVDKWSAMGLTADNVILGK